MARSIDAQVAFGDRVEAGAESTGDIVPLRVLLAERRTGAHSELAKQLLHVGHEVLARVSTGQGVADYAELLRPDVVIVSAILEDGPGIMTALALTKRLPGIAAVVLTDHPAAEDPRARPNWGAVSIFPAAADAYEIDAELRRAVARVREAHVSTFMQTPAAAMTAVAPSPAPDLSSENPVQSLSASESVTVAVDAEPVPAEPEPMHDSSTDSVEIVTGDAVYSETQVEFSTPTALADFAAMDTPAMSAPQLVPSANVPAQYDADMLVIADAAECLLERTGLSRADAMRLMEQEAADSGQALADVARAVLGRDQAEASAGIALEAVA